MLSSKNLTHYSWEKKGYSRNGKRNLLQLTVQGFPGMNRPSLYLKVCGHKVTWLEPMNHPYQPSPTHPAYTSLLHEMHSCKENAPITANSTLPWYDQSKALQITNKEEKTHLWKQTSTLGLRRVEFEGEILSIKEWQNLFRFVSLGNPWIPTLSQRTQVPGFVPGEFTTFKLGEICTFVVLLSSPATARPQNR